MMHELALDSIDRPRSHLGSHPALAAAIGRVIDEPVLADRLAEGGWRRYQADYTEEACVAGYIELFERLLAERAGGERAEAI
jgi:glycosyltransferase involved in cell wall biosynthesis